MGVKRPGHEADHSPPSSAEVKECVEIYLHTHNTPPWCDAQLKNRDEFTIHILQVSYVYNYPFTFHSYRLNIYISMYPPQKFSRSSVHVTVF
jgi:hypothetical protein